MNTWKIHQRIEIIQIPLHAIVCALDLGCTNSKTCIII